MYIRLDRFADMLCIRPCELLQAVGSKEMLEGIPIPRSHQVRGATMTFLEGEVNTFLKKWQTGCPASPAHESTGPLISLDAFSRMSSIAPLALWQAARSGKPYRRVALPVTLKSHGSHLMFCANSAEVFIAKYKRDNC